MCASTPRFMHYFLHKIISKTEVKACLEYLPHGMLSVYRLPLAVSVSVSGFVLICKGVEFSSFMVFS